MKLATIPILLALSACATTPTAPKVITATQVRYVPIPAEMDADCPIPAFTGTTFGDGIEYAITLKSALVSCNGQMAAIRSVQGSVK